jgi:hypothetical protein
MKSLKASFLAFLAVSLSAAVVSAANTGGYVKVTQLKAWTNSDAFHVYLEDVSNGRHTCANTPEFRLAKAQLELFRLLMAAQLSGKTVQVEYSCSGTTANISGVRMQ